MVIHGGRIDSIGEPERIGQRYLDLNFVGALEARQEGGLAERASIPDAWVTDELGHRADTLAHGHPIELWADIEAAEQLEDVEIRIWVENEEGTRVFAASTLEFGGPLDPFKPGERRRLRVRFANQLVSDSYHVSVLVCPRGASPEVFAVRHRAARFSVVGGEHVGGIYDLEHELDLEPVEERTRA
jgi:hypothetical protein